ncbi:hypothetical protein CVT25_006973 [Psilocybe cyanescens]|uniref:Uncharacterized protein n=1 Tax=Psilocybe cyanescens TaxID=93625 RepID=A0A409VSD7_PSICY|nr:hypothetical protein CVT25_006973 [Psilocybe cyanescens]
MWRLLNTKTTLPQSTSHPGYQPKRHLHEEENVKREHLDDSNTQRPLAPWVDLGDGNADKEAEKLIPSPNFYVHSCS